MCVFRNLQFRLIKLEPAKKTLNLNPFLHLNSEISNSSGLLVMIWKMHYTCMAFTMKMNSDDKVLCGKGI
jgi:hypothetical protein